MYLVVQAYESWLRQPTSLQLFLFQQRVKAQNPALLLHSESCLFWLCHKKGKETAVWKYLGNEKISGEKKKYQGPIWAWQSAAKDPIATNLSNFARSWSVGTPLFAKQRALQIDDTDWSNADHWRLFQEKTVRKHNLKETGRTVPIPRLSGAVDVCFTGWNITSVAHLISHFAWCRSSGFDHKTSRVSSYSWIDTNPQPLLEN